MGIIGYINPLTTDDAMWRRLTLAACYHLAQFVLKVKWNVLCIWQVPWSALAGPFLTLLAQTGSGTTPLPL